MVAYQEWTEIAFSVARDRGFQSALPTESKNRAGGRSFPKNNPNAEAIRVFARIWNDRKDELQDATRTKAREIAEQEVTIS